jgi:uncharacterized protein YjbJ (UPF0337 family)
MMDDMLKTQWNEIRSFVKDWFPRLTEDELNVIDGRRDRLIRKLQEKYTYTQKQAGQQIDLHLYLLRLQQTQPLAV